MDLSLLHWVKVITDDDDTKWAYTRQRLKEMNNVIDENEVTIFPLGFRNEKADEPKQGSIMALIQKGKLTHIVEVLDQKHYYREGWFHRLVRVSWWKPDLAWENLPPQSSYLGFNPTLMDGNPHLIVNLRRYRDRWEADGEFDGFKQYLMKNLI